MKFIHLADCHLATPQKFESDMGSLIREKTWESFEHIFASNKDVDFALIAGDLFERNFVTSEDFKKIFDIFRDFGKDIYYVTGNHDYFDDYNSIFLNEKPNNLYIFTDDKLSFFEKDGMRIYGLSYKDRINNYDFPYDISLDSNYFNILLAHADIYPNPSNYLDLDPKKLTDMGFSYVALGHVHNEGSIGACYYPSSIEPFSYKDTYTYGYILYDDGKVCHIDSALMKFNDISINARDFNDEADMTSYVNGFLDDRINFLRINIEATDELDTKIIQTGVRAKYCEINVLKGLDPIKELSLYPDSLLAKFYKSLSSHDDDISKRALSFGMDAILRTKR